MEVSFVFVAYSIRGGEHKGNIGETHSAHATNMASCCAQLARAGVFLVWWETTDRPQQQTTGPFRMNNSLSVDGQTQAMSDEVVFVYF